MKSENEQSWYSVPVQGPFPQAFLARRSVVCLTGTHAPEFTSKGADSTEAQRLPACMYINCLWIANQEGYLQ